MSKRFFTVTEVNHLIPQIQPLMAELINSQARLATLYKSSQSLLNDAVLNVGSLETSELTSEMVKIEELLATVRAFDCYVKDIKVGLVDFLTEIDGREVYLCWRYGESEITHYHDLESGFNGRQPLY